MDSQPAKPSNYTNSYVYSTEERDSDDEPPPTVPQKHYGADEILGMDAAEQQNVKEQGACMSDVRYQHRAPCTSVNPNEYTHARSEGNPYPYKHIANHAAQQSVDRESRPPASTPDSSVQANNESEYSIPYATIGEVVNTADEVDPYDYVSLRQGKYT